MLIIESIKVWSPEACWPTYLYGNGIDEIKVSIFGKCSCKHIFQPSGKSMLTKTLTKMTVAKLCKDRRVIN